MVINFYKHVRKRRQELEQIFFTLSFHQREIYKKYKEIDNKIIFKEKGIL